MKSKNTKRALVMSAVALLLCAAMLAGATFAWFTDTASTGVNKIQSGSLDVELEYSTDMVEAFQRQHPLGAGRYRGCISPR